tara:strand:- start:672 stop:1439 length:768 start_codon:yes stop_codon:yes gene_type:complete
MVHPKFKITGKEAADSTSVVSVTNNKLDVNATLTDADIQIGSVEIKDATSSNRAIVDGSGNLQTEVNNTVTVVQSDAERTITGTVVVNGSSVTQPVSGTVTANLGTTDNAVLDSIDAVLDTIKIDTEAIETAVEILDNAVSGNEMQVDIVTNKHPEGMTSITTFARFAVGTSAIQLSSAAGIDASPSNCKEMIFYVHETNDGYLYIGDSSTELDRYGIRVNAGDTLILPLGDTADVYLDGSDADQFVSVTLIRDI